MRFSSLLPLVALSTAFVIPDDNILTELAIQNPRKAAHHKQPKIVKESKELLNKLPCPHHIVDGVKNAFHGKKHHHKNPLDRAFERHGKAEVTRHSDFVPGFDTAAWLDGTALDGEAFDASEEEPDHPDHPPHHGPPHKGPKHPGHGHKRLHHGHHKSNATIYQLISTSKYTTKLAKLIDEDKDLVKILNSTKANFTVFAPTDHAFEKLPDHGHKPPKEFIKNVLLYHISPGLYPAGRLLFSHTVPTLYNETLLGDKPQRLVARLTLKGVLINYYSKVVAVNIGATNGIIHGVDSIIVPPPKTLRILELLPGEFSTLLLGLGKTGLIDTLTKAAHVGGTFFAPPNGAFKKLGPAVNAFLFSSRGEKYLKALLEYHVVANQTVYSNKYYGPHKSELIVSSEEEAGADTVPYYHFDLPTLLEDKSLAVDIARFGPFISYKLNGFVRVVVQDGVAKDGVIQVVNNVLVPPKTPGVAAEYWNGEEMDVEEFKQRLGPFVEEGEDEEPKFDL